MKVRGYRYTLGIGIAVYCLLHNWQLLRRTKRVRLKLAAPCAVNYVYGSYESGSADDDAVHRRGDKIGDADLEIFRVNADYQAW